MIEADTTSGKYWRKCGEEALAHNVKGVIIIGAHWECLGDKLEVATNPNPGKSPCPFVDPKLWTTWKPNPDSLTAERCIKLLAEEGYNVSGNSTTEWHHDVFMVLIRMFPEASTCPPTTVLSTNARYDPHYHVKIGATLRRLRHEGFLFIGSGGAVHNLYRNIWGDMLRYRDSLGQRQAPASWALEFRQATEDAITRNSGPDVRAALIRLMKHPSYREAHATDEHFIPALFCAGVAGDWEDAGHKNVLGAESWELTNMCNSQYTFGEYSYGSIEGGAEVSAGAN
jgi:aromatic ring-opening dioxygenase catalytic subunit (LigB family)